jgi:hypothetical protein
MTDKPENGKGDDTAKRTNRKNFDKGWDIYTKHNNRKKVQDERQNTRR